MNMDSTELLKAITAIYTKIIQDHKETEPVTYINKALLYSIATLNFLKNLITPYDKFIMISDLAFDIIFRTIILSIVTTICVIDDESIMKRIIKDDLVTDIELGEYILKNQVRFGKELNPNEIKQIRERINCNRNNLTSHDLDKLKSLRGETEFLFKKASKITKQESFMKYYHEIFKLNSRVVHPSTLIYNKIYQPNSNNVITLNYRNLLPHFYIFFIDFLNEKFELGYEKDIDSIKNTVY
jgi:hypothetical protein